MISRLEKYKRAFFFYFKIRETEHVCQNVVAMETLCHLGPVVQSLDNLFTG